MKKIILLYIFIHCALLNLYSQSGWFQLNSFTTDELSSVRFVNQMTGYVQNRLYNYNSSGTFWKTTNAGLNWVEKQMPFEGYFYVQFINGDTGFSEVDNSPYYLYFMKTTNSGNNWNIILEDSTGFGVVYFKNPTTGFLSRFQSICKSTNSGNNWFTIYNYTEMYFGGFMFPSNDTAYVTGWNHAPPYNDCLFKTTNGGSNWSNIYTYTWTGYVYPTNMFFASNNVGYLGRNLLNTSTIFKTTDGGYNWFTATDQISRGITCIFFNSVNIGYASANYGSILKTTDGGYNWVDQREGIGGPTLNYICFTDPNTGYAVGGNGLILKTTNAGEPIGIKPISSQIPREYSLSQNYPNPFNPITKIKYQIPKNSFVSLRIFDLLGNEVAILVNENKKAGYYEVNFDGTNYASGVYFYRIEAESFVNFKKMMLIK